MLREIAYENRDGTISKKLNEVTNKQTVRENLLNQPTGVSNQQQN